MTPKDLEIFRIRHNGLKPKAGMILISEPFSQDMYFKRSVVFLTQHSDEGSAGFILNNPFVLRIEEIIPELKNFNVEVSIGGPVSSDSLFYVHKLGDAIPNSIHIINDLYWGGNFEILKVMIQSGMVESNKVRFFLGYSGWQPNQLKNEIESDYWLVSDINTNQVMNPKNSMNLWTESLENMGGIYRIWATFPEDPRLN